MLVLSRKSGESIRVGDNITVTALRIGPNSVRIGIEAPRNMNIVRTELLGALDAADRSPGLQDAAGTEATGEPVSDREESS